MLNPGWTWYGVFGGWSQDRVQQVQHFIGWQYIAIKAICEEAAGQTPHVAFRLSPQEAKQRKAKGFSVLPRRARLKAMASLQTHEELEIADNTHPLVRLLANPNGPDVSWSFFYRLFLFLELTGNSYVWVVNNEAGLPQELWVIPSHWVFAKPGDTQLVEAYEIRPLGIPHSSGYLELSADDIIPFQYPHPLSMIDGFAPSSAIARWVDVAESIDTCRWFSFKNGPKPTAVVTLDKETYNPDPAALARFKDDFRAASQGERNAGEPIVPPPGTEVTPFQTSPYEMDYVPGADQMKSWLLAAYRVGESIAGLSEQTVYASMVAARANFKYSTMRPKLTFVGQVLTEKLAHRYDEDLFVYWPDETPEDPAQKLAENQAYLANGVKTVNEVRAELGLEPYPHGGDDPMVPMGISPIPFATGEEPEDLPVPAVAAERWDVDQSAAGQPGQPGAPANGRPRALGELSKGTWPEREALNGKS